MPDQPAAFFDLDRTLVRVNTARRYVRWRVRQRQLGVRKVLRTSYWTVQYALGLLDAERVSREAALTLQGIDEDDFRAELAAWVEGEILREITPAARAEVEARRAAGDVLAMLTSGSPYVANPVAAHLGIGHVLCTRFEVEEGRLTGRVIPPVCYGSGKVAKASAFADAHGVDLDGSRFYSDSISDVPMLERVGQPMVVNPDLRLRRLARRRGWPVLSW
ncbi:MAG: HAD family hydrolase [Sandaracinaceae bacterium]